MSTLIPGTEVVARGLRWEVVSSDLLGDQTLYRLRGRESATLGHELDLLYPFEAVEPVRRDLDPERAAPLTNWLVYHQAFLLEQSLGMNAFLSAAPGRLRVEPYQLVPVLRALRMSRPRLLLADGVGLGKTIQAGLILTELIARRMAHRILVVAPAGPLLEQWQAEMLERFGLRLETVDRARLEQVRRSEELGANPFDRLSQAIASPEFLKQEYVLQQLERSSYDVIVLDEAHHYMDTGGQDRGDTQRRRLAETLAHRCDTLLLLTATPHDGNDRSFASLCELLDPSLLDSRGALRGDRYRAHVVRRLKRHLPGLFKERIVIPTAVVADKTRHAAFIDMQHGLLALIAPQLKKAFRERRYSDVLAFIALLKRSVSTAEACGSTLRVVVERYQALLSKGVEEQESRRQRMRTIRDYQRRAEQFGALSEDEQAEVGALEIEDLAQQLAAMQRDVRSGSATLAREASVTESLDSLIELAGKSESFDPKLDRLVAEINGIRAAEPDANVLVYTEYVDSQNAAARALRQAGHRHVLLIRGSQSGEDGGSMPDRRTVTDRFQTEDGLILVSTDAAAEGLNLHQRCHHLIHLELPFNPNRMEQRNGRIDRYGQTKDPIVRYLYLQGTFEERILFKLIAKFERQRARLNFMPNTLGLSTTSDAAAERLLRPLMDEEERLFSTHGQGPLFTIDEAASATADDAATNELLAEIDRSLQGFQRAAQTSAWLSDLGINATQAIVDEAGTALARGERSSGVDLLGFVRDAVLLEGGAARTIEEDVFELTIPHTWQHGLEYYPGYSAEHRRLLITTSIDRVRDRENRPLGYLGRAHPVVRKALDRIRNVAFGDVRGHRQDARVSAVAAPVKEPELLFTFVGRVNSRVGRELERLFAVRMDKDVNYIMYADATEWIGLADPARGIKTTDLWHKHFSDWGAAALDLCREEAARRFAPIAAEYIESQQAIIQAEIADLDAWLAQRCYQIRSDQAPAVPTESLFDEPDARAAAEWRRERDPFRALALIQKDSAVPASARAEAKSTIDTYEGRKRRLNDRLALSTAEVDSLGMLMLIPEVVHAA